MGQIIRMGEYLRARTFYLKPKGFSARKASKDWVAIGFIFWIRAQVEETLQGADQSEQVETTQPEQNVRMIEDESLEQAPDQQGPDSPESTLTGGLQQRQYLQRRQKLG